MQLTIAPEEVAVDQARNLIERAQREASSKLATDAIIEVITTIAVYKFTNLSREEVEAMLGWQLEDSRILREAKEEGGREKALAIVLRLLTRRVGELDEPLKASIQQLPTSQLEDLSEALLDFRAQVGLLAWLETRLSQRENIESG